MEKKNHSISILNVWNRHQWFNVDSAVKPSSRELKQSSNKRLWKFIKLEKETENDWLLACVEEKTFKESFIFIKSYERKDFLLRLHFVVCDYAFVCLCLFMFDPYQLTNGDWGCFAIIIVKVCVFRGW